mmetsp:Transcript_16978/g.46966  ORF Transcript_16978/g.46966 Transcript_16978/m.46966 type:complete len:316 (+) Transcript_16978:1345-2292(+)
MARRLPLPLLLPLHSSVSRPPPSSSRSSSSSLHPSALAVPLVEVGQQALQGLHLAVALCPPLVLLLLLPQQRAPLHLRLALQAHHKPLEAPLPALLPPPSGQQAPSPLAQVLHLLLPALPQLLAAACLRLEHQAQPLSLEQRAPHLHLEVHLLAPLPSPLELRSSSSSNRPLLRTPSALLQLLLPSVLPILSPSAQTQTPSPLQLVHLPSAPPARALLLSVLPLGHPLPLVLLLQVLCQSLRPYPAAAVLLRLVPPLLLRRNQAALCPPPLQLQALGQPLCLAAPPCQVPPTLLVLQALVALWVRLPVLPPLSLA